MITERIEILTRNVLATFPSAKTNIEIFDSGAAMVEIRVGARLFVCSFTPSQGYGIDEIEKGGELTSTFSHAATDEIAAAEVLIQLIKYKPFGD